MFTELVMQLQVTNGRDVVAQTADVGVVGRDDSILVHLGTTRGD